MKNPGAKWCFVVCAMSLLLALSGCQSSGIQSGTPFVNTGTPVPTISGNWHFAYLGSPTISTAQFPRMVKSVENTFKGSSIFVNESGALVMSFAGGQQVGALVLIKEDSRYGYYRDTKNPVDNGIVLDKSKGVLVLNTPLRLPNGEGTIPAVYQR